MTQARHRRTIVSGLAAFCVGLLSPPASVAATGLQLVQQLIDGKGGIDTLDHVVGIAVSPDGLHVYAASRSDNALTAFSRNGTTGVLTLVEAERDGVGGVDGLAAAAAVAISPDGHHVYVASKEGVAVFDRDGGTGEVTVVQAHTSTGSPDVTAGAGIAVSPDGAHVYLVTGRPADGRLITFSRDAGTGQLTFVQELVDDQSGIDGLARATSVAVSPDGHHVYATGQNDDSVVAFGRSSVSGALTLLQQYQEGVGGVVDMRRPASVAVSPDGEHVYVAAEGERGVTVFDRDTGTGLLTYVEGRQSAERITSVAVTPDGSHVVGTDRTDPDGAALFARDAGTGTLTPEGGDALAGAQGVAISPDGLHVYAGTEDLSVGVFRFVSIACSAAPVGGCLQPVESHKAALYLKDATDVDGDKLTWKWIKGAALTAGAFGDPVGTQNDYVLCIYDSALQPILQALAPAAGACRKGVPCWKATGTTGFKYKDPELSPHGLGTLRLKAGVAGSSAVTVKGKKRNLPTPSLPLSTPVTVQLQSIGGACWSATYSSATVNGGGTFKAKAD